MLKACKTCNQAKPWSEFRKRATSPDGLQPSCKVCVRNKDALYRQNNRDRVKKSRQDWLNNNPTYTQDKYKLNKNQEAAKSRAYYQEHKEEIKARSNEYYAANKTKVANSRNRGKKWAWDFKTKSAQFGFNLDPDCVFTPEELVERWDNVCYLCGDSWVEIDHVMPVSRGGRHSLDNCKPCCRTCNVSKGNRIISEGCG